MAMADHLMRFRRKSTEWLLKKEKELEEQETIFAQQSMGNTSMTRDLRLLQEQLAAIAYVLNERNSPGVESYGVTDFSGIK